MLSCVGASFDSNWIQTENVIHVFQFSLLQKVFQASNRRFPSGVRTNARTIHSRIQLNSSWASSTLCPWHWRVKCSSSIFSHFLSSRVSACRSLRISTLQSDSACSSSTESDGETTGFHTFEPFGSEPVEIFPGLFLGNAAHSEDSTSIQKYNIRYILNVSTLPNVFEETGKIKYLQIPITDHWSQDMSVHFAPAISFIEESKARNVSCLVHCLAGVSRVSWSCWISLMREHFFFISTLFSPVGDYYACLLDVDQGIEHEWRF